MGGGGVQTPVPGVSWEVFLGYLHGVMRSSQLKAGGGVLCLGECFHIAVVGSLNA